MASHGNTGHLEDILQSDVPLKPKVRSFEDFLENKLRPDLRSVLVLGPRSRCALAL